MNKSKLSKAQRLANNIRIQSSVHINRKHLEDAQAAIKLLGMKLDEFIFEDDEYLGYINIIKKSNIKRNYTFPDRPKHPPT